MSRPSEDRVAAKDKQSLTSADSGKATESGQATPAVTNAAQRQQEGWFGPGGSKRFHYFDSELRALCGKWMLWRHPEDAGMEWGDAQTYGINGDCAECARRLEKRKAKSGV